MDKQLSDLLVFFGSIVKFFMVALTAIAANLGIEGSIANVLGGVIGIVLFTYLGSYIQDYLVKKYPQYFSRKFTPTNRFMVKVKQKFGLRGIAIITPVLLSIPIGVLVALTLTHDKKKIMVSMIISMLFWATLIFVPYFVFHINIGAWLAHVFE